MIKEIKYNGFSASPSDYESPDGDLASMINMVNEKGGLIAVTPPETIFTLESGQKVLYIHKTSDYCNYIVYDTQEGEKNGKICFFTDDATNLKDITTISNRELYQINSIGNTLVILTNKGLIYALYKSGNYVIMGDKPEFPSISFRLQGTQKSSEILTSNFSAGGVNAGIYNSYILTDEAAQATQNVIFAYTDSDSANTKNLNKFQYPFMIRYAYRLYDESLYILSAPIKMTPSEGVPYLARVAGFSTNNGLVNGINMVILSLSSSLYYEIINFEQIKESLANWTDLVKSIDIFITPNLNGINKENSCHSIGLYGWGTPPRYELAFVRAYMSINEKDTSGELIHREYDMAEIWGDNISKQIFISIGSKEFLPVSGALPFYLISSIDIKDIAKGEKIVPIDNGVLNGLEGREVLEGDSQQSGTLVAKHAFTYNSRLNLANITIIPPSIPLESCIQYLNGEYDSTTKKAVKKIYKYKAYIFIESEKQDVLVDIISNMEMNIKNSFFFYPNPKAFRLIIEREDSYGVKTYSSTKLSEHKFLNGSFTNSLGSFKSDFDTSILKNTSRGIPYYNKIYTSEVNNPFSFPATGVNAIGSGEILGIRSATKALSQGQFGQFPLYAFTDEGIWALEVSSTGSYSARQPITRDVCVNSDSITQIDNAVLFATDRGIMLISGSTSQCISDSLDCESAFSVSSLPHFEELINNEELNPADFQYLTFREYLKGCKMIYDYTHQRIIVYNPSCTYAYLYSMESKQWGMMHSDIDSSVNSYPDALAMTSGNELINFSKSDGKEEAVKGMLITRPIKIDSPNLFKTIDTVIQRGYFHKGHVSSAIYGSRDLFSWNLIWSSKDHYLRGFRGTPYKYFRIVLICNLDKDESVYGCSIQYTPRLINKLR